MERRRERDRVVVPPWFAYARMQTLGDGELSKSPEIQRIAALAVFESRQQVIDASKGTLSGNLEVEIQKVADFFPNADTRERANLTAIGYIPDAASQVEGLIYRERGSAPGEFGCARLARRGWWCWGDNKSRAIGPRGVSPILAPRLLDPAELELVGR